MFDQFFAKAAELTTKGEAFAIATVVRYVAPSSGKPGDKAIINAEGELSGWIGGGCAQPVVIKEALKALQDGQARLVRISPAGDGSAAGVVDYTMTCHSGGALDIFIEPILPKPHLLILGRSPVAQALARLAKAIHYSVSVAAPQVEAESFPEAGLLRKDFDLDQIKISPQTCIVVSTQGEHDEEALEQAVGTGAGYIAFVASKTKTQKVLEYLREKGISPKRLEQVRAPAGIDIGAEAPAEIAVSILAEMIQARKAQSKSIPKTNPLPIAGKQARDPICGMEVDINTARYKSEHHGDMFYFCCPGCKKTFEEQPEKYATGQHAAR
ncbi:MAG TPA: XdhC family protein [Candidatus Angelobacter sp.]|jgi:xanthine dehydrogenase accessory factor|nr:XdhC family protein [Candidatus Angelobacter sp.]